MTRKLPRYYRVTPQMVIMECAKSASRQESPKRFWRAWLSEVLPKSLAFLIPLVAILLLGIKPIWDAKVREQRLKAFDHFLGALATEGENSKTFSTAFLLSSYGEESLPIIRSIYLRYYYQTRQLHRRNGDDRTSGTQVVDFAQIRQGEENLEILADVLSAAGPPAINTLTDLIILTDVTEILDWESETTYRNLEDPVAKAIGDMGQIYPNEVIPQLLDRLTDIHYRKKNTIVSIIGEFYSTPQDKAVIKRLLEILENSSMYRLDESDQEVVAVAIYKVVYGRHGDLSLIDKSKFARIKDGTTLSSTTQYVLGQIESLKKRKTFH